MSSLTFLLRAPGEEEGGEEGEEEGGEEGEGAVRFLTPGSRGPKVRASSPMTFRSLPLLNERSPLDSELCSHLLPTDMDHTHAAPASGRRRRVTKNYIYKNGIDDCVFHLSHTVTRSTSQSCSGDGTHACLCTGQSGEFRFHHQDIQGVPHGGRFRTRRTQRDQLNGLSCHFELNADRMWKYLT